MAVSMPNKQRPTGEIMKVEQSDSQLRKAVLQGRNVAIRIQQNNNK